MVSGSHAVNPSLYHKLPYDSVKDFEPVTIVVDVPSVIVAHPSLRLQSVSDLVALAKERGGKLNYGSSGTGTFAHLAFEMFNRMAGITIEHVPYKGNAPAMADLLGGQVQAMISAQPAAMPHVRAGKLAALGVTSAKRSPQLPDVPTIGELLHGYEFNQGFGILAPAGMPAARIDRVQRDIVHVLNTPAIQKLFSTQGAVPVGSTPQEYGRYLRTEMAKLAEVVRMSGARAQ
jgi:tripartite-type tricarboxylate transporter receptor subunit TctC